MTTDGETRSTRELRIGFFSIGLASYWAQYTGLKCRLAGYADRIAARLRRPGVEVVDARTLRFHGKDFLEAWTRAEAR